MQTTKIIKHRKTIAPFECSHCGFIWYGWNAHQTNTPKEAILCTKCSSAWDHYIDKHYDHLYEPVAPGQEDYTKIHNYARIWINDKQQKPTPLPQEKRFKASVPKWMRSAINQGMVQTNAFDKKQYIVYSQGDIAIKVDVIE